MNTKKTQLLRAIVSVTAGIMVILAATASWAAGSWADHGKLSKKSDACYKTTRVMRNACNADIIDDYFENYAKCLNTEDVNDCKREVRYAYEEAKEECRYEAAGRDDLCARLPDAGPYIADLDPDDFTGECSEGNPWYPLVPGTVTTFVSEEDEGETVVVEVTHETRVIEGIVTIVVRDTVYEGLPDDYDNPGVPEGNRIEDTDDYYAIANNCDVWYLGELSQGFEDTYLTSLDGSFVAGENGAQAGIIMLANPMPGDVYRQEFALGDAEDAAEVLSLATDVVDENGNPVGFVNPPYDCIGSSCLKTEDFIANDPDGVEFKYFKYGVGFVAEQVPSGEVVLMLIKSEVLP